MISRKTPAAIRAGLFTLILCWIVGWKTGYPVPRVHDEFCYLLQADTFLHGRLTNPTPAFWPSFETFHVTFTPTYTSKYQPGQGLLLAMGKILFGHEIWGVWLACASAALATTWALSKEFSESWSLFGGSLAGLIMVISYWSISYWGGALAAFGGALVLGSALSLLKGDFGSKSAASLSIGVGVLGLTRPFEGGVEVAAVSFYFLGWRRDLLKLLFLRRNKDSLFLFALTGPALGATVFQLFYNRAVTGSFWILPYFSDPHDHVPAFLFQTLEPFHAFQLPEFNWYYREFQEGMYRSHKTWVGFLEKTRYTLFPIFVNLPEIILFAGISAIAWWRKHAVLNWFLAICFMSLLSTLLLSTHGQPHYIAPFFPVIVLFWTRSVRALSNLLPPKNTRWAPWIIAATVGAMLIPRVESFFGLFPFKSPRNEITQVVMRTGGTKHLILVDYGDHYKTLYGWIYNAADIDSSSVIWARFREKEQNERLLEHYQNRKTWLLKFEGCLIQLIPLNSGIPGKPILKGSSC